MRKFMNLIVETITGDLALNHEIETILNTLPKEDASLVLDGLEIIQQAGPSGVSIATWVSHMRFMWPDNKVSNNDALRRIFKLMLEKFDHLITRDDGVYIWHEARHTEGDIDLTSPLAQMAKAQIEYTGRIMELMREMQTFTATDLMARFSHDSHLPVEIAGPLVQHVIDQARATVKPNGDGSYRWEENRPETGLSFLRGLDGYQPRPDA